ncbi:hypothetical protein Bbelb_224410 [Branchiostoma belcheri]|nr:hypothetical protein Bbelb_224410 [Branchiostoma belcheri]
MAECSSGAGKRGYSREGFACRVVCTRENVADKFAVWCKFVSPSSHQNVSPISAGGSDPQPKEKLPISGLCEKRQCGFLACCGGYQNARTALPVCCRVTVSEIVLGVRSCVTRALIIEKGVNNGGNGAESPRDGPSLRIQQFSATLKSIRNVTDKRTAINNAIVPRWKKNAASRSLVEAAPAVFSLAFWLLKL